MQCPALCQGGYSDFTCYGSGGGKHKPSPDIEVWTDDVDKTKKGLLGTSSATNSGINSGKAYMDFATLNDATKRNTWLDNAFTELRKIEEIPPPPTGLDIDDKAKGNLHGTPTLITYMADVAAFQTRIKKEYCFYQTMYYVAVLTFLNNYENASASANALRLEAAQDAALACNNKLNTLIAWMNYLSEKQQTYLINAENSIKGQDQSITNISNKLTAQAAMLNTNTNSSLLYQEMVNFTSEKNQANQNLLALYFTLNVIAIASLFVIAKVL